MKLSERFSPHKGAQVSRELNHRRFSGSAKLISGEEKSLSLSIHMDSQKVRNREPESVGPESILGNEIGALGERLHRGGIVKRDTRGSEGRFSLTRV